MFTSILMPRPLPKRKSVWAFRMLKFACASPFTVRDARKL